MSSALWMRVLGLMVVIALGILVFWLGVWYGFRWGSTPVPPRPTICAFCGGQLRSELVWSSVCRTCNRGQIGHYPPMDLMAEAKKRAPPFVSHVDVGDRRP
jgi:hypothetical protein